jgi:hypothetical protein
MEVQMSEQISHNKPKLKLVIKATPEINLNTLLDPYKNCEFIPTSVINPILQTEFPSHEMLHKYNNYHLIIKTRISDLLNANITNWDYNRPPDMLRCGDIARYIYESKKPIDTTIYLSFNANKRSFDVVDGIHRYSALKIIKENNSKSLDLITPSDFGNNNDATWLYDSYIMLCIRFNSTEGDIIELFKTLNKSAPIPELYIRDASSEKRNAIESVANIWQIKYSGHFSSNQKPNKPNVNRDRFIDLLDAVYEKHKIINGKKNLASLLEVANWTVSTNLPKKLTTNIVEKCAASGCWLFVHPIEKLIDII